MKIGYNGSVRKGSRHIRSYESRLLMILYKSFEFGRPNIRQLQIWPVRFDLIECFMTTFLRYGLSEMTIVV